MATLLGRCWVVLTVVSVSDAQPVPKKRTSADSAYVISGTILTRALYPSSGPRSPRDGERADDRVARRSISLERLGGHGARDHVARASRREVRLHRAVRHGLRRDRRPPRFDDDRRIAVDDLLARRFDLRPHVSLQLVERRLRVRVRIAGERLVDDIDV